MAIHFSQLPGRHERHYRRKLDNPLFPGGPYRVDEAQLLEAQRLDHEELLAFLAELRHTVQSVIDLQPNVGSEVVLELKERLDRLYEQSAGLADEQGTNQDAIRQLLEVIMRNVERGAAGDPQAMSELARERRARAAHFELLSSPLVADLLHPQSTIGAAELGPSLLSEGEESLAKALQLFDVAQLGELVADTRACLTACGRVPAQADARLRQIETQLASLQREAVPD